MYFQCSFKASLSSSSGASVALLNFSTSSQIAFLCQETGHALPPSARALPSSVEFRPFSDAGYICSAASLNGGNVLQKLVDDFRHWVRDLTGVELSNEAAWKRILELSKEDDGASGIEVNATLFGERSSPQLTGSIANLTQCPVPLGALFNAHCRGLARNLAALMPPGLLRAQGVRSLLGSGGCLERVPALKRELEAAFGMVLEVGEAAGAEVGAALFAMM